MKRFLKNIIIFSTIIIILLTIGELTVRHLPSSYSTKYNYLRNHGDEVSTLILGSSHTYYGIIPEILGDSVFNLANISQSPEYDLYLLEQFEKYMPNLKSLIIPISYFTYRDPKLEDGPEWMLAIKYKTRMKLDIHSNFSIYNFEIFDFESYSGALSNLVLNKPSNKCTELGFGLGFTLNDRNPNWKKMIKQRIESTTFFNPGRYIEVLNIQRSLLNLAKQKGWKVIFITTPSFGDYTRALEKTQESEMREGIKTLIGEFDVKYLDFLRDSTFIEDDFHDADHLSDIGATKFSSKLRKSLIEIIK